MAYGLDGGAAVARRLPAHGLIPGTPHAMASLSSPLNRSPRSPSEKWLDLIGGEKTYPGFNVGLGQKFYFGKSFALRIDFKIQYQQGPNPFLATGLKSTDPIPAASAFGDKFSLGTILDFGFTFLL